MLALLLLALLGCTQVETGRCENGIVYYYDDNPDCVPVEAWQCPEGAEDTSIDSDECEEIEISTDQYGNRGIGCDPEWVPFWICE